MTTIQQTTFSLAELGDRLAGEVIAPGDAEYDAARAVHSRAFDRRPAAIVRPRDAAEVASAVSIAREHAVELAIRSGGHGILGHGTSDGGIVLDLSALKRIDVDARRRVVAAEAGALAGEVTAATTEHGLAVPFGDTGSVGIGGLTLGGGVGYLVRKHGLTIDSLLAADVVTADGELLHVDAQRHADLFWAIRGGGGNFGVATRFVYRLHDVSSVVGGLLVLPATPETVAGFAAAADAAPDAVSSVAIVMPAPPLPFLAEEQHGRLVIMATLAYTGPFEESERALAPFRVLAEPLVDLLRPLPYRELFPGEEPPFPPFMASETLFAERVDRTAAAAMLDALRASTAPVHGIQLRVLGGEVARVPADATAYAHRAGRIMVGVAAAYTDAAEQEEHEAWAAAAAGSLRQGDDGAYVNFLRDDAEERVRAAYPGDTWERLRAVKRRYDPGNVFHVNHNIPPAEKCG